MQSARLIPVTVFLLIHEAQQGCRDATYEPSRFPVAVPYPSPHRATPAYVVVTSSDLDTSRNKASVSGFSWISRTVFVLAMAIDFVGMHANRAQAQEELRVEGQGDEAATDGLGRGPRKECARGAFFGATGLRRRQALPPRSGIRLYPRGSAYDHDGRRRAGHVGTGRSLRGAGRQQGHAGDERELDPWGHVWTAPCWQG